MTGRAATLLGCALATTVILGPSAASAAVDDPLGVDSHDSSVHLLSPGATALWPIGVTTDVFELDALNLRIDAADDAAAPGLLQLLTVQIRGCQLPWVQSSCARGETEVVPPSALTSVDGSFALTSTTGSIPRDVELLVLVTMADDDRADRVQGAITRVTVTVDAAGLLSDGTTRPPPNPLPNTGVRIAGYLLLGLASVLLGSMISRAARRRRPTAVGRL